MDQHACTKLWVKLGKTARKSIKWLPVNLFKKLSAKLEHLSGLSDSFNLKMVKLLLKVSHALSVLGFLV
jgi:hypothetical protein